ncbi:hypothetical protein [Streptococcus suis]|uniref:hypothetical protein n=1 Tax=Streptococcus suis TaxID=1307 RepID=UPI0009435871|nr:hypothetical protein [Streptococcus suis]MBS8081764.1 hypothetical protein [Streptococcus suis]MCB2862005.1 hypothetical protein [Streptococcus suis]MCB2883648.1 hypothetical protein [Streptococcus suis]MCB2888698.1 hypothetical protein [Streptococcus suis]MCB2910411.1 hypothetical protein [Streptococcus suis]
MKDKFSELEKIHKILVELSMEYVMAPLTVGQTVLQMINDLHNDKEQFGAQSTLPSPDGKYNFIIRVFRESDVEEAE